MGLVNSTFNLSDQRSSPSVFEKIRKLSQGSLSVYGKSLLTPNLGYPSLVLTLPGNLLTTRKDFNYNDKSVSNDLGDCRSGPSFSRVQFLDAVTPQVLALSVTDSKTF